MLESSRHNDGGLLSVHSVWWLSLELGTWDSGASGSACSSRGQGAGTYSGLPEPREERDGGHYCRWM